MLLGLGVAIDDYIAQKGQELGGAVLAQLEIEQLRRGVNQRRCRRALAERGVVDHVFQERNIRLHPANAELPQRAVHALQRHVKVPA